MDIGRESGNSAVLAAVLGRRVFRAVPEQVREAREWLRNLLGEDCDDAVDCLSEIFTNTIIHTVSGATQGRVSVVVLDVPPRIRIEVTDAGAVTKPHVRSPDDSMQFGRGLLVVDALTSGRWGWEEEQSGRRVWLEVPHADPVTEDAAAHD